MNYKELTNNVPQAIIIRSMTMDKQMIRVRLGQDINNVIYVPDGGEIESEGKCYTLKYVDPTHFYCGTYLYHRDELAEALVRNGRTVRLVEADHE